MIEVLLWQNHYTIDKTILKTSLAFKIELWRYNLCLMLSLQIKVLSKLFHIPWDTSIHKETSMYSFIQNLTIEWYKHFRKKKPSTQPNRSPQSQFRQLHPHKYNSGKKQNIRDIQKLNVLRLSRQQGSYFRLVGSSQQNHFKVRTLRSVDVTTYFVKNNNPITRQVQKTRHYLVWKGKPPFEAYNEVRTSCGDKAMNRTSSVTSLKTVLHLYMMITGAEDLDCDWQNCECATWQS